MSLRVKKAGYQGIPGATVASTVTITGTQTITGEKTFSAATIVSNTLTVNRLVVDSITIDNNDITGIDELYGVSGTAKVKFPVGLEITGNDTNSSLSGFRLPFARFGGSTTLGVRHDNSEGVKTLSGTETVVDMQTERSRELMVKSANIAYALKLDFAASNTESTRSTMGMFVICQSTKSGENAGFILRPATNCTFNDSASDMTIPAESTVLVMAAGFKSGKRACTVLVLTKDGKISKLYAETLYADALVVDTQQIDSDFEVTGVLTADSVEVTTDGTIGGNLEIDGNLTVTGTFTFSASTLVNLTITGTLALAGADISGNPTFLGVPEFQQEVNVITSSNPNYLTRLKNIMHGAYTPGFAAKVANASGSNIIDANDGRHVTEIESSNATFKITLSPVTSVPTSGIGSIKYLMSQNNHSGYSLVPSNCYLNGSTAELAIPANGIVRLIGNNRISSKINYIAEVFDLYGRQQTGLLDTAVEGDLVVSGGISPAYYWNLKESAIMLESTPTALGTYMVLFRSISKYELIRCIAKLSTGTATLYVYSDGSAIAGPFSVSTIETEFAISSGSFVNETKNIAVYVSAVSSAVDLYVQIDMRRVEG